MKEEKTKTNSKARHSEIGRIFASVSLLIFLLLIISTVEAKDPHTEALVKQAWQANPELKSIDLQIQALGHKANAVQMWMDPVLMVEYSNFPWDTWSMGDSPMTGVQFKLQQTFTLAGKNSRRKATVQAEAESAGWSLAEKRNQLAGLVKRTYWGLSLVRQLRVVTKQHIELVRQLIEAIRAKYQVGKVGQHELMRLEVLQVKLADDLGEFDRKERELSAALNTAMHRPPTTFIVTSAQSDFTKPSLSLNEWVDLAKKKRPALKILNTKAKAKRLAADAAGYERWPDIAVWAGYRIRSQAGKDIGGDQMSLGIAIPLPFNYTGSSTAKKAMHLSEASAITEQKASLLDEIKFGLESALAKWERAIQKVSAYSDKLIPKARQTLESTLSAYQTDRADFASLYQAELQLLDFERTLLIAKAQTWIQQANVKTIVGDHSPKNE